MKNVLYSKVLDIYNLFIMYSINIKYIFTISLRASVFRKPDGTHMLLHVRVIS